MDFPLDLRPLEGGGLKRRVIGVSLLKDITYRSLSSWRFVSVSLLMQEILLLLNILKENEKQEIK
jgi:hypothetical protein